MVEVTATGQRAAQWAWEVNVSPGGVALTPTDKGVLLALCWHVDDDLCCRLPLHTVVTRLGLSMKPVRVALKRLREYGLVEAVAAPGKVGVYKMPVPADFTPKPWSYAPPPPREAGRPGVSHRRRHDRLAIARSLGQHTAEQWGALVGFCGGCVACRKKSAQLTKDHIEPISKGGHDGITNIQPLCLPCNSAKGARPWRDMRPEGWREAVQLVGGQIE